MTKRAMVGSGPTTSVVATEASVVSGPDSLRKPRKESTNRPSAINSSSSEIDVPMSYSSVTMSTTNLYAVPPTSNAPVSDSRSATIANTS